MQPCGDDAHPDLGPIGRSIGFQMRRIQNQLSRDFALATAEHNLRAGFFSSLSIIAANPGISQIAVSRAIGLDTSATVQIVDDMERRGYAERRRSTTDRRCQTLHATESGERFLDELTAVLRRTEAAIVRQIAPDEFDTLMTLLSRMYAAYAPIGIRRPAGGTP